MAIHRKRIVFFIFVLCFGLGCCLGSPVNAVAEDPPDDFLFKLFIASLFNGYALRTTSGFVSCNGIGLEGVNICEKFVFICDHFSARAITDSQGYYKITGPSGYEMTIVAKKEGYEYEFDPPFRSIPVGKDNQSNQDFSAYTYTVSGKVTDNNGAGLKGVEIYGTNTQLAVTDSLGNYQAEVCSGKAFTLTPQLAGFTFTPASHPIPVNQYNQVNKDFTAQTAVTISGNVIWKNHFNTTIPSNPLPMVAMEAWAEDGSLSSRSVTDANGNYSLSVPGGWTGWVKPVLSGFEFWPEKIDYNALNENKIQDYYAPSYWGQTVPPTGHVYKITVSVKRPGGALLPPNEKFIIWFNGINHANGSKVYCQLVTVPTNLGECSLSQPSGWIGDIVPTNFEGGVNYTFAPASYHMNEILTSDLTFSFEATE